MTRPCPSRLFRPARGYCLVVTILLVAIAASMLAVASRRTISKAMQAEQNARDLQRRWGFCCVGKELAGHAGELLQAAENEKHCSLASESFELKLGSMPFEIRISDENAKLDVNALLASQNKAEAARTLQRFLSGSPLVNRIQMRTSSKNEDQECLESFGDVFLSPTLAELTQRDRTSAVSDQLTCFGSGKLNIFRASDEVIRSEFTDLLGGSAVSRLLTLRRRDNLRSLPELVDALLLIESQRQKAINSLAMSSDRYSLWILADHRGKLILQPSGTSRTNSLEW